MFFRTSQVKFAFTLLVCSFLATCIAAGYTYPEGWPNNPDPGGNWHHFWLTKTSGPVNPYVASSSQPNGDAFGHSSTPYGIWDKASFDSTMTDIFKRSRQFNLGYVIHLLPGTYLTTGLSLKPEPNQSWGLANIKIRGAGASRTDVTIRLEYSVPWGVYQREIFYERAYVFEIANLTLDCNFDYHWPQTHWPAYGGYMPFKTAGVAVFCARGWAHNLIVEKAGAQGGGGNSQWSYDPTWETFPILLTRTEASVAPFEQDADGYARHLKITECIVRDFQAYWGGYGTAICIAANTGDASELGGKYALVADCAVYGTLGSNNLHAYGTARIGSPAMIEFVRTDAWGCLTAFNCDSLGINGKCDNVSIRNSIFQVNQGIHVGAGGSPIGSFNGWVIESNTIDLRGPYFNKYAPTNPYTSIELTPNDPNTRKQIPFGVFMSAGASGGNINNNTILRNYTDTQHSGYCVLIPYSGHNVANSDNHHNHDYYLEHRNY